MYEHQNEGIMIEDLGRMSFNVMNNREEDD